VSRRPARPSHDEILWLQDYLPYRIAVTASRMLRAAAQVHKRMPDPLTTPQWRILAILANFEPLRATELARISMLDKVAISRALAELERRGFVLRTKTVDDRRAAKVTLTAEAWRYYANLVPEMKRQEQVLRQAVRPDELRLLFDMLDRFDRLPLSK